MNRPRSSPRTLALLVVLAALALSQCGPAEARGAKRRPHPRATSAAPVVAAPTTAGAVIAVDPETGRLGLPSPEQMLELTAAERTGLLRTTEGLTQVQMPDGSWMSDLQGRFQTFSFVRLDPYGERRIDCVDDLPALWRALTTPATALEDR